MPGFDTTQALLGISIWALPILFAITLHEAGHAYAANRRGDPTARLQGRMSLNPLVHVDIFGTVLLPLTMFFLSGFVFGYAKPVPVDWRNFRNPKRDMMWVALAGPAMNLLLAIVAAIALPLTLQVTGTTDAWLVQVLLASIQFNCIILFFNMLPLPPLDGGRVIVGLLPRPLDAKVAQIEPYGMAIIMAAFFLLPFTASVLGIHFDLFRPLVGTPADLLANGLLRLVTGGS